MPCVRLSSLLNIFCRAERGVPHKMTGHQQLSLTVNKRGGRRDRLGVDVRYLAKESAYVIPIDNLVDSSFPLVDLMSELRVSDFTR